MAKINQMGRLTAAWWLMAAGWAAAQSPANYSIPTPKPISPAEGTTNPSASATQRQNPYLGSVPEKNTGGTIELTLDAAIRRGLMYNLGLVESNQARADVRAERMRALSTLLPQISGRARQGFEAASLSEIGIRLPASVGFRLPPTTGNFAYQDARVALEQSVFNAGLRARYRAAQETEKASALSVSDSRDVVVLAVATAYLQVIASQARVETAKAQLATAGEFDQLTANRVNSEVSPEIESLRAQVQRQSAEQRLANVSNQLEKDRLTLARVIGLPIDQEFKLAGRLSDSPSAGVTVESATVQALQLRSDLAGAAASVKAAEMTLKAQKAERLPVVSLNADYGGAGINVGNFNQVYSLFGDVTVPILTGGRIRADIEQARADLAKAQAEYEDLKGRIAYDVRVAFLDVTASQGSVRVAENNRKLAQQALAQSRDRYVNGVTNYLEIVQAEEAVSDAEENYIQSLYSLNVSMISLARAMGGAENRISQFLGDK